MADFIITGDADISSITSKFSKLGANIKQSMQDSAKEMHQFAKDTISSMAIAERGIDGTVTNLSRLRYALYDVSSAAAGIGNNLVSFSSAAVSASADFETAFTSVERASQVSGDAVGKLREELMSITRSTPLSFADVTQVATLGAQLGVATENLKSFSTTVSEFSSTTGMSVEATARAFGSLGELLNLTADQYQNLGSAIAFAGVNAVATEAEIVSVATAIAGIGTQAGLSAEYTIGLSTALASLRVPAEQSRGALTRIFQEVNRAATVDPNAMDEFANVLGVTTAEANKLAETDMETFFNMFIDGMSKVSKSGGTTAITSQLDALNLSDIRVTNTIARLAGNTDLLKRSMADANTAFDAGTYLAESFALKADDLASRFARLQNAITEFTAQMGDAVAPIVGMVTDALTWLINTLTDIAKNPAGKALAFLGVAFAAVAGAAFVAVGAIATLSASYLAMRVAAQELNKASTTTFGSFGSMLGAMTGVEVQTKKTTGAFYGLTAAQRQASMAGGMENLSLRQQNALFVLNDIAARKGTMAQATFGQTLKANVAMINANIAAMSTMQKVTAAAGWIGLALTAVSLLQAGWEAVSAANQDATESNKKYAEQMFGSSTALAEAMRKDAAAASTQQTVTVDVQANIAPNASNSAADYASNLGDVADAQNMVKGSVEDTTKSIDAQTAAYGENTKEALAGILAQSEEFSKLVNSGSIEKLGGSSLDYTNAILGDPVNGAKDYTKKLVDNLFSELPKQVSIGGKAIDFEQYILGNTSGGTGSANAVNILASAMGTTNAEAQTVMDTLKALGETEKALTGEIDASADAANTQSVVNQALAQTTGEVAAETENAAGKFETFKGKFDEAFGKSDALTTFSSSLGELISGIESSGTSFSNMTSGGAQNLQNLRQAMYDSVNAAKALGVDGAAGIGMVFAQLQQSGVETAGLLEQLKQMGGQYAQSAVGIETAMSGSFAGLTSAFNAMKNASKKASSAADDAANKFRTAKDVASDFSSVVNRAMDLRFDRTDALDKISSGWSDIADNIKEADNNLKSINADIKSLTADKSLKEYWLSVAEAYGDSINAEKIRADLAKIDDDISAKQDERQKAQDEANKTLKGNSSAAIKNRATMRGMVGTYQTYINSLIESGASQATVSAAIKQSKDDFNAQAVALGYSADELKTFTGAFDDMLAINRETDYRVTVDVSGLDPAKAALLEFKAKAEDAAKSRTMSLSTNVDYAALNKWSRGIAIVSKMTEAQNLLSAVPSGKEWASRRDALQSQIDTLKAQLSSGNFASGGYTGAGGKYQIAGIVHKGEYVVPKDQVNQATKTPYFMSQPRTFAQGGYAGASGPMMVTLAPEDRALLRGIGGSGEVVLYANNEALARSVNAGNKSIVAAGGRP